VNPVNRLVVFLETHLPACVRKGALWALFRATARAFDRPIPRLAGLSADECLLRYAQFTQGQVTELLLDGDNLPAVQERLYRNAYELGRACRGVSRIGTVEDAMALGRVLYSILDIEFQGDEGGNVVINRCYFSRFYSGQVCQVMSAVDRGLFAGLSDGRQLVFSARITEGEARCRAHLNVQGDR
jgi:hypothetical protein